MQAAEERAWEGLFLRGELVVPHRDRRAAAGSAARPHGQGRGLHRLRQELHRLPLLRRAVHAQQPHQQRQEALPLHVSGGELAPAGLMYHMYRVAVGMQNVTQEMYILRT